VSRKDFHPKSSTHMSLQLVKSRTVSSTPVRISLEELQVTTLRTRLVSEQSEKKSSGALVVVDVSKQNEDGLSASISPMVRIQVSRCPICVAEVLNSFSHGEEPQ